MKRRPLGLLVALAISSSLSGTVPLAVTQDESGSSSSVDTSGDDYGRDITPWADSAIALPAFQSTHGEDGEVTAAADATLFLTPAADTFVVSGYPDTNYDGFRRTFPIPTHSEAFQPALPCDQW